LYYRLLYHRDSIFQAEKYTACYNMIIITGCPFQRFLFRDVCNHLNFPAKNLRISSEARIPPLSLK
jgi:hypothetical protein